MGELFRFLPVCDCIIFRQKGFLIIGVCFVVVTVVVYLLDGGRWSCLFNWKGRFISF